MSDPAAAGPATTDGPIEGFAPEELRRFYRSLLLPRMVEEKMLVLLRQGRLQPVIGRVVTGNRAAYEYLPRTAAAFPSGEQFLALMKQTGRFADARATPLLFGTAWVYVGTVTR